MSIPLSEIINRDETKADFTAISAVAIAAFKTLEISNHTEQFIIEALRSAGALTLSLVAEYKVRIIGHIAFSPITISDAPRAGMASVPSPSSPSIRETALAKPSSTPDWTA